ncbi:MAG: hypothetical protein AUI50_01870 [Crenarchaeota archaeon 13_1_40CM_2_52_14]|nr:MAG: hypothetical protein AUI97_06025 [Crenarchaeota archaeon 13_1_40CM_3_52_17]OLD35473.1 MAG: hypothetical protein AUI50_01870 [Crenarchaeota archaeon 13_1_40CM_2_52_14]OLE70638.1 MAG: hypothetical protein AUF78_05845 [archaeon 13_1_20CM_2_51_12]
MVIRSFFRVIISLVGGALPLLFLSGSYSPLGSYLPNLLNLFGNESSLGTLLRIQASPALPMGAAGLTGFATYSVLQRVLSTAQAATYSRPSMDTSQMMRQVQNMMPGMGTQTGNQGPLNLPGDMTRAQFLILTKYQQGFAKPKDIAKHLSMDKRQVEKETNALKSNGYLSEKNKLTSKGLETLS